MVTRKFSHTECNTYSQCEAEEHDQVLYLQQQLNVCTMTLQHAQQLTWQSRQNASYTCSPHRIAHLSLACPVTGCAVSLLKAVSAHSDL